MSRIRCKAFASVTHRGRLLRFRHPDAPETGLQVPAGTVEEGEAPEAAQAAALREAREETGLGGLVLAGFLGEQLLDMAPYGRAGERRDCRGDTP